MCKVGYLVLSLGVIGLAVVITVLTYTFHPDFGYTMDSWTSECKFGRDDRLLVIVDKDTDTNDLSVSYEECRKHAGEKWGNNRVNENALATDSAGFKYCDWKFQSASPLTPTFTTNQLGCTDIPNVVNCIERCEANNLKYSSFNIDYNTEGFYTCRCGNSIPSTTNSPNWFKFIIATTGPPDTSVSEGRCQLYATQNSLVYGGQVSSVDRPNGCYRYNTPDSTDTNNNKVFFNTGGQAGCNDNKNQCIKQVKTWYGIYEIGATYNGDRKGCFKVPEHTIGGQPVTERIYYGQKEDGSIVCQNDRLCIVKELRGLDTRLTHCGTCGSCSTVADAKVYLNTSNTLTGLLKRCSIYDIAGGQIDSCIDSRIGFTDACKECFKKNIECTKKRCGFVCGYETTFEIKPSGEDGLSKCIKCDEKYCGKKFKQCAGMTRRRAGILSSLDREKNEICKYEIEKEMEKYGY